MGWVRSSWHAGVLLASILIVWRLSTHLQPGGERQVIGRLAEIPFQIDGYRGGDVVIDTAYQETLDADDSIFREYLKLAEPASVEASEGTPGRGQWLSRITLYVGYWGTKKGGRTGHNPYACYPSAGWAILEKTDLSLSVGGGSTQVPMLLIAKGGEYELVAFWYQDKDVLLSTGIRQNIARFTNRVRYGKDEGAFVRVSIGLRGKGLTPEEVEELKAFASAVASLLPRYWPQEIRPGDRAP